MVPIKRELCWHLDVRWWWWWWWRGHTLVCREQLEELGRGRGYDPAGLFGGGGTFEYFMKTSQKHARVLGTVSDEEPAWLQ